MKKRNKLNRYLAIALTAAMTLQQSSIVGFASDIDETPIPVVTEAPAPVQEAQTPAPEAAAPAAETVQETPAATAETPAQDTSAPAETVTEPAADQANTAAAADEAAPAADTADKADETPAEGAPEENASPEAQENAEGSTEAGTADASDQAASADEGADGTAAASSDEAAEADAADPAAEVVEEPAEEAAVEGDTAAEENADDTEEDEEGEESEEDKEESEEEEPEPTPTPEPTRRVYTGGTGAVTVTATLQYASAVPDDAQFIVNQTGATDDTLVFDIYFLAPIHDEEGNVIGQTEYEPEEGSVTLTFRFNQNQLSEDLGADKATDVTVVHVHDSGYEEVLNASVSLNGSTDRVTVQTDSFSTYYFKVENGTSTDLSNQTNTWNNNGQGNTKYQSIDDMMVASKG